MKIMFDLGIQKATPLFFLPSFLTYPRPTIVNSIHFLSEMKWTNNSASNSLNFIIFPEGVEFQHAQS